MSVKFLDDAGLAYLWGKIKDWVHSLFVHKVGDETITGSLVITRTTDPIWMCMQHTKYTKGTNPSRTYYHTLAFTDSAGTSMVNRTGFVECYVNSSGVTCTQIAACKYESGSSAFNTIGIFCNPDGTAYTYAPTPAVADNSTKIATTAFVKAQGYLTSHQSLANYVTLDSAQTVTGKKTFNGGVDIYSGVQGQTASLNIKSNYNADEGGQINFLAPDAGTQYNGFFIDNYKGKLRLFGLPSADGTSKTGNGTILAIDVYDKTITGGYTFTGNVTGNCSGTSSNVTGTVAIANGGTGATTRLDAVKNLTNESVGTSAQYFLTITDHWGKAGYTSIADAKTVLGLKSAAYTESSAYVDVTSNQTVAGEKTFTNRISANFSVPYIVIANTDYTKGTIPSNTKYSRLFFSDTTGDVVSHRIAMVETSVNSSGRTAAALGVYKYSSTETTAWGGIGVYYDADGTSAYTSAPNPPGDDSSTKIATTYFVNQNYVTRATDQTISGKKTFTQELHFKNGGIASPTAVLTAAKYFNLMFVANDNNLLGRFLYYNNANNGTRGISVDLVDNTNVRHTVFTYAIVANGTSGTVTTGDCITKFCPTIANCTLGGNSTTQRWGQIYSSITTISTSDERVKTEIANVPDEVLDCWEDVSWVQFKMVDSVKEKGDSARLHNGMIAQNIKSVFESSGLDASKYGLFCYLR